MTNSGRLKITNVLRKVNLADRWMKRKAWYDIEKLIEGAGKKMVTSDQTGKRGADLDHGQICGQVRSGQHSSVPHDSAAAHSKR